MRFGRKESASFFASSFVSNRSGMLVGPATARHTATVIFHHGFGATATDWTVLASIYPALSQTKFLFPQAPLRPITIAGGQRIPAWFDILQQSHGKREKDGDEDEVGMREAIRELEKLILKEVEAGIPVERIVIGGFSQGAGLVALQGAIGKVDGLAGICMLSGYVPLSWKVKAVSDRSSSFKRHVG